MEAAGDVRLTVDQEIRHVHDGQYNIVFALGSIGIHN